MAAVTATNQLQMNRKKNVQHTNVHFNHHKGIEFRLCMCNVVRYVTYFDVLYTHMKAATEQKQRHSKILCDRVGKTCVLFIQWFRPLGKWLKIARTLLKTASAHAIMYSCILY